MGQSAERLRTQATEAMRTEGEKARRVAEAAFKEGRWVAGKVSEQAATAAERIEATMRVAGECVRRATEGEAERQDIGTAFSG